MKTGRNLQKNTASSSSKRDTRSGKPHPAYQKDLSPSHQFLVALRNSPIPYGRKAALLRSVLRDLSLFGNTPEANLAFLRNASHYLMWLAGPSLSQALKLRKEGIPAPVRRSLGLGKRSSPQDVFNALLKLHLSRTGVASSICRKTLI